MYERDIRLKLLLLRTFFLLAVTTSVVFFYCKRSDYGFVTATLLVFASIIPITKLKIEEDSFIIAQYYLFGFILRKQVFMKGDDISVVPFDFSFSDDDANNLITSSFLDLFLFSSKATIKRFVIKEKDFYGNAMEFKMKLSEKEYVLIKDNFVATPVNHVEVPNDLLNFDDKNYRTMNVLRRNKRFIVAVAFGTK